MKKEENKERKVLTYSKLIEGLSTILNEEIIQNLSVNLCFSVILHIANENSKLE